jgi:hypothetical protein
MSDDSPPFTVTKEKIFGTDSESDSESCQDDHDASGSAVSSRKRLPRGAPEGSHRARLTVAQKLEAVKHYQENPGMSHPQLIEWSYKKFDMKKKLSRAAVSL